MTSKGLLGAITPKHFDVRENLHPTKELRRDYTIRFARRRYLIG